MTRIPTEKQEEYREQQGIDPVTGRRLPRQRVEPRSIRDWKPMSDEERERALKTLKEAIGKK